MEKQVEDSHWIPIESEVPKFECHYFVTMKLKCDKKTFVIMIKWNNEYGWCWDNGKKISDLYEIIAWQSIKYPKPYKKEII